MTQSPHNFFQDNSDNNLPMPSHIVTSSNLDSLESEVLSVEDTVQENFQSTSTKITQHLDESETANLWLSGLTLKKEVVILAIAFTTLQILFIGTISWIISPYSDLEISPITYFRNLLIGTGISAVLTGVLVTRFRKQTMQPILRTANLLEQLAQGKLNIYAPQEWKGELALLGNIINKLAARLRYFYQQQQRVNQQRRLISNISALVHQSLNPQFLFDSIVEGAREILKTDRVIIYRFNIDWTGTVVAESVGEEFPQALGDVIGDPCFRERHAAQYQNGRIRGVNDIYKEPGMTDCYIRLLEKYKTRANLVVPIRQDEKLMGLLITHQCSGPRVWQRAEINFLSQLAAEVESNLDYINFVTQKQNAAQHAWFFGDIAFRARQSLSIEEIFKTTVQGTRKILQTDRVLIYHFNPDWSGTMVAESAAPEFPKVLDEKIDDPCFRDRYIELYRNGRIRGINNIYTEPGLTDCHIRTLEKYEVKANLVAPLRQDNQLIGLIIAHHCSKPRAWQKSDIDFLSQLSTQIEYALDHLSFVDKLRSTAGRARLFGDIAFRARQSLSSQDIFNITVEGARKTLKTDRVLIYRFNPDWSGVMVAESVASGFPKVLDEKIDDPCFRGRYVELYKNGRVRPINDIYAEPGLTDCHIRTLEQYDVKANLVAPIRRDNQLVGLLIAHHCSEPRTWQKTEIDFFSELATQAEYALDHVSFIDKLDQARQTAELASQEQRHQKEAIQSQLKQLLEDIQGAFQGDLTVRAQVREGEFGTVSEFLNATIENLQRLVVQVQSAASAVTQTAHGSEENINTLSTESLRQAEAITFALGQIQGMTDSIQSVASNSQQAKLKVQQANQTLQEGDEAMNHTVEGILAIQETVEETAQKLKRLGESSQKISRVVNLIRDLASQTHILALNASIEANGGLQEGQGFAVVAEEVRSLSEQSTTATKEIEEILEEIQTETNQVIIAMEAGREQVITGTELVETTRQKLNSIATVSGQIRKLVEEMAQAATAQAKTSASVSITMQEVETIAQQTSEQSVAGAESFTKLLGVAEELQKSVAKFKVQ